MTISKLSAGLLLGTALILTACGDGANTGDKNPNVKETMTNHTARASKAIDYTDAGKTDADHIWLEEVESDEALAKVKAWNTASEPRMRGETYKAIKSDLLSIYNSPEKIPYVSYRNGEAFNFWQDDKNVKGIWRKTTLDSYSTDAPQWETILDVDKLAESEGKNWVYKGSNCLAPDYIRCLVSLSNGGKDAIERREFNSQTKAFVKDGFFLSESKGGTAWLDKDNLLVGVDFGPGTMTDSGYPMIVKLWQRGTDLADAREIMRGEKADVGVWPASFENAAGEEEVIIIRSKTFYTSDYFWVPRTGENAFNPVQVPIPDKSNMSGQFGDQILVSLQEDWRGHETGALVSFSAADFMDSGKIGTVNEVFKPGPRQSVNNVGITKDTVLISISENVSSGAYAFNFTGGKWAGKKLNFPENGTVSIGSTNHKESVAFINTESFLQPDTLWSLDTSDMSVDKARSLPNWFDADNMVAEQFEVASTDGTMIPYYMMRRKDTKMDGKNPTLLYGYGGFEISINPAYSSSVGKAWVERGGVYVSANMRGGGEFGPKWHQAGLKTKRQIIYDDFISVAEDLIDRKVTSPKHLGTHGRSNGGLLMGVMFTQRPDLFNAVAIGVPLLDMNRYDKLLAGASWVGEYGDPDDDGVEGAFIRNLSPYHNIDPNGTYPVPYIYTSTKDDRVHPAHARKFAQRLEDYGFDFLYYENIDGGHAGGANLEELARRDALIYAYFHEALK